MNNQNETVKPPQSDFKLVSEMNLSEILLYAIGFIFTFGWFF